MHAEPIEEVYFKWLCAKVMKLDGPPTPSLTYWNLLRILHNTEYVWLIPNDDNRVEDGLELRTYFLTESRMREDPHWINTGCSVLEMLIAFANRAEFSTETRAVDWFWIFIENLGLKEFNDAYSQGWNMQYHIETVLETFVWRQYTSNGQGGLFPLSDSQRDQRDVEVWYQFCDYLVDQTN